MIRVLAVSIHADVLSKCTSYFLPVNVEIFD